MNLTAKSSWTQPRRRLNTQQPSSSEKRLIAYFYSGWAFFIPYLLTYLLYLWQKWPANSFAPSALGNGGYIPALLHVYWALHAIHLVLAIIALRTWWKNNSNGDCNPTAQSGVIQKTRFDPYPLLPWIFLALIFAIPGVYLEWPADPWEHLRRITEWSIHPIVGEHSAGYKSFYFFAYSFISVPPNLSRFGNVNIYGTCIDLLLAWQYYRLAKAVGLNQRWSFLFVLVNALTFGNVCFSFYKYYTLATTMYAQLGAVALTRITIEFVQKSKNEDSSACNPRPLPRLLAEYIVCLVLLLAFVACNHVQGIGIAGLGIGSILVWRLLDWKRSASWGLVVVALILSIATILWWPRHHSIDTFYRPSGWLNAWYGFNLFAWPSPATDRAIQILGLFGVINLVLGFYLIGKNLVAGWLTVGPIIAVSLPMVALPFSNRIGMKNISEIVTFHRLFFALPSGLAIIYAIQGWSFRREWMVDPIYKKYFFPAAILILAVGVSLAPDHSYNNRLWQLLRTTPDDLQLKGVLASFQPEARPINKADSIQVISGSATSFAFNTFDPRLIPFYSRQIGFPVAGKLSYLESTITFGRPTDPAFQKSLVEDPFGADHNAWISFAGSETMAKPVTGLPGRTTGLKNPAGQASQVFNRKLVPIDPDKTYHLEISLKQSTGFNGTVYLAAAWYDRTGHLQISDLSSPNGAHNPPGWANGVYSYFGLINGVAPSRWTTFKISFGREANAKIPPDAKFLRIGALLNFNSAPGAEIYMTNVLLWEKSALEPNEDGIFAQFDHRAVEIPEPTRLYSNESQAARASGHWPAQQTAVDLAGQKELLSATRAATGRASVGFDELIELP
ncbi:MAG TPA: hypothetical protein VGM64_14450 [Lacunisphaera sp.]